MGEVFKIGTIAAEPGTTSYGTIKAVETLDGNVEIPVILVNGTKPGSKLYVGSTIHGNELTGIEVIRRILEQIEPGNLSGTLIALPVQNPLAFRASTRMTFLEEIDANRTFPGKADGGTSERISYTLLKIASKSDAVIDLHCGFPNIFCITQATGYGETSEKSLTLAKIFGVKLILVPVGKSPAAGDFSSALLTKNIPDITVELGGLRSIEERFVVPGVRGILNVMKYLNMIDGEPEKLDNLVVGNKWVQVLSPCGGVPHYAVDLEDEVSEGDLIASVYNPYTLKNVADVRAPIDGFVNSKGPKSGAFVVQEGERIATLLADIIER